MRGLLGFSLLTTTWILVSIFLIFIEKTLNGDIKFYSRNPIEREESENVLPCQYDGEKINIRLDWNLLHPILKNFPSFQLHIQNDHSPVIFANNMDRIVLMPLLKK